MTEGPDGDWFDKGRRTDVAGFGANNWQYWAASPLKRWWRENWFQPVARIGELGNYEHGSSAGRPLPIFHSNDKCPAADSKRHADGKTTVETVSFPIARSILPESEDRQNQGG